MASLNKVMLIGNVGRDPEVRYLPAGDAVANRRWQPRTNGKTRKETRRSAPNGTAFRSLAVGEIAGEYLKKGQPDLR